MEEVGRITRAAGVVSFFTLLSRLTGLLRDMVIGYLFGAQGTADAFFVAFRIPNLLRRLTAEGALTAGFIPVFTDYLTNQGKAEAMRVARIVFTFLGLFLAVLTLLGMLFAAPLTQLFAPGFLADRGKFGLTVFLTRLMFPYVFFVSLVALAMGVLNSLRHFMAPALSPVLLNLSIICCAILFAPWMEIPVISLGYGVLLGGVAQLLLQLPYLSRQGFTYSPDFHFKDPVLKRLLFLMGPAFIGAAVYQINVLVSTIFASMLPEGSVSYLYYADRLLQFPLGIFAVALGTAALPSFSSLVAKKEYDELKLGLSYSLRLVNFFSLPATLGLMIVSVPIFSLLFQRGAFDANATLGTAQALIYFSFGLWGFSGT
ncbi:MAG: murein biosynthesis integral membrane protein MurJ, partial [Candidatus Binatota bacterium]